MNEQASASRLRIGFIGSGLIAQFHLAALESVRDVDVIGVFSPTAKHRERFAATAVEKNLGP